MAGQTYNSDALLAQYAPFMDANGFIDGYRYATANGYTILTAGQDTGDATDLPTAVTRAKAVQASGKPVCVVLRRGATFSATQCSALLNVPGLSPKLPTIWCASDDTAPRPILQGSNTVTPLSPAASNQLFCGLDIYNPCGDPSNALFSGEPPVSPGVNLVVGSIGNLMFEDCRVRFFSTGIAAQCIGQTPIETLILRRCILAHNWGGRAGGLYSQFVQDLLVNDCVVDANGAMAATKTFAGYPGSEFDQNVYIQRWDSSSVPAAYVGANPQTRIVGLLSSRAAAQGNEQRSGGLLANSLFVGNPIAGFVGPTGVGDGLINGCIVDGGGGEFPLAIPGQTDGWGLFLNAPLTGTIANCIAINKPDAVNDGFAFGLEYVNGYTNANVPVQAVMSNLIAHGWTGPSFGITFSGASSYPQFTGKLSFEHCDLPGYTVNGAMPPGVIASPAYVDATRTVAKYAATLGIPGVTNAATLLNYIVANQNRMNWNPALTTESINAWIQAGFQLAAAA